MTTESMTREEIEELIGESLEDMGLVEVFEECELEESQKE